MCTCTCIYIYIHVYVHIYTCTCTHFKVEGIWSVKTYLGHSSLLRCHHVILTTKVLKKDER